MPKETPRKSLSIVTPPASEPVSIADLRSYLGGASTDSDALIESIAKSVRESVEAYTNRTLIDTTYRLTLDSISYVSSGGQPVYMNLYNLSRRLTGGQYYIELMNGPVKSISSVQITDLDNNVTTYSADNYTLDADGERLLFNYGADLPSNQRSLASISVTYVAGFDNIPEVYLQAIKRGTMVLYDERSTGREPRALTNIDDMVMSMLMTQKKYRV